MKILWLASWYPSRIEPYNGDFVQRHAQAASMYHDIAVFHVIKDPKGSVTKDVAIDVRTSGRLTEHIIYYHSKLFRLPLVGKLFSAYKYRSVFKRGVKEYLVEQGKPDLVHLHVCTKAGAIALWLKRNFALPYVVTEHATHFLPEDEHPIHKSSFFHQRTCRRVLRKATAISTVSHYLGKAVQAFSGREYQVIPNVVNTSIFKPKKQAKGAVCRFLHISGLGYQKNPEKILSAFVTLKNTHSSIVLDIVGPENNCLQKLVVELCLSEVVNFHTEMPQPQLAALMQNADALVLFSRYETFGCVLIEANACGVPVVVNNISVMQEVVIDGFNGFVVPNNVAELATTLKLFVEKKTAFDPLAISRQTEKSYGYKTIGEAFSRFYRDALE